ncbi:MAG: hypothetical protein BGP24_21460 [Lysobacterales bacterium 69-70]|nr:sel1 repeat family protein [Xanthomonadaceae bacterium]ODU36341.1 MAG: hypothetical protein ABS97_00180 [Xanthomonadaceae bacterium SCN 69-320]ODV21687.1 MAG: hypothetical protein ABT27_03835 [Xanthomonadaceae bacterium SCN 69-25]OJY95888.1 MAG: hypothetical protein BGP24_21460 [Xanthomonadales bacterium 69-70]
MNRRWPSFLAASLGLLVATAAQAIVKPPPAVGIVEIAPAPASRALDFSALPPELSSLRLDAALGRPDRARLSARCGELVPLARGLAQQEPQRPGPLLVLVLCARAAGDKAGAAAEFQRLRERVAASLAPPGIWQGDDYYYGVGSLDIDAVAAALSPEPDSDLLASTLETSLDGYRLQAVVWLRETGGHVRRFRVDITPSAERVMRYLSAQAADAAGRDSSVALAGYWTLGLRADEVAADSRALVGWARITDALGLAGDETRLRKDFERAVAQGDVFGRYAYAEWLLRRHGGHAGDAARAAELLRRAAADGLPEAQALLSLWCERRAADCARGEAARWQAAAERGYGAAEAALLRHETALRLGLDTDAAGDLARAVKLGSTRAFGVRLYQLAQKPAGASVQREFDALLQRAVAADLPYALDVQGSSAYARARTAADRTAALALIERAATRGNASAAARIGIHYAGGVDAAADWQRAVPWFRLAAERGDPAGQFNLATALLHGLGLPADPAAARVWYLRSAAQGHAASLAGLGDIYASGAGVAADPAQAAAWYAMGARSGHARSRYLYAVALDAGDGVAQDRAAARQWYSLAAEQGIEEASLALAKAQIDGDGVERSPQAGMARLETCFAAGSAVCRRALADLLASGPDIVRNVPRALALYEEAAATGDAHALAVLGLHYENGLGVDADPARAFGYYTRCAEGNDAAAGECAAGLARAYYAGRGAAVDRAKAVTLLRRARELGSTEATCTLGEVLRRGGDATEAMTLLAEAANAGNARCAWLYGRRLLEAGPAQAATAMSWLRKAVVAGEPRARADIVVALLDTDSPLHDKAAARAYLDDCVALRAVDCIAAAGVWMLQGDDGAARKRGAALLEQAARAGSPVAAEALGKAAYYGRGSARDAAAARRWLAQAGPSGLAEVLLARLELAAGDRAAAQTRLVAASRQGNALAHLLLVDLCAADGADCGADAPTVESWRASLERRGEAAARDLFHEVAWSLATDPLATAAEAGRLLAIDAQASYGLGGHADSLDTRAGLLARAGRGSEACALARRLADDARRNGGDAGVLRSLQQHRDTFCRGAAWVGYD